MNGPEGASAVAGNSLGRFYSYKNTFDEHSIWVDIPKKGTACYCIEPQITC